MPAVLRPLAIEIESEATGDHIGGSLDLGGTHDLTSQPPAYDQEPFLLLIRQFLYGFDYSKQLFPLIISHFL